MSIWSHGFQQLCRKSFFKILAATDFSLILQILFLPLVCISAYGCDGVKCTQKDTYCMTDQYNQPRCVPDTMAPLCNKLPENPICATNGVTYKNICFMTSENIKSGTKHLLSYHSACQAGRC